MADKDKQIAELQQNIRDFTSNSSLVGDSQNRAIAELTAYKSFAEGEIRDLTTKLNAALSELNQI